MAQKKKLAAAKVAAESERQSKFSVPRSLQWTMIITIVIGIAFIWPYVGTILFAALVAFLFNPVYKYLLQKTHRNGIALLGTFAAAFASVLIPLAFIVTVTIAQTSAIISDISSGTQFLTSTEAQELADRSVERVNGLIRAIPGGEKVQINQTEIETSLKSMVLSGLNILLDVIKNVGSAFFGFISAFILALFLIVGMLTHQEKILATIRRISPYDEQMSDHYLNRVAIMTKAMVKGQFIIATIQGFASAASLWIVGIDYFWFFAMFLSFMSFIPLGAGIITIPIGIVMILLGNVWQGIFLILYHMIVVSSIDNFLRPHLVPKEAALNTALMLLAVFAGMAFFGAAGVIIGPVIMILITTTISVYGEYNKRMGRVSLDPATQAVSPGTKADI